MKKSILILGILLIVFNSYGQQKVKLSFLANPHISWFGSNDGAIENHNNRFGISFGINADIPFLDSEKYTVSTGLLVNSTGGKLLYAVDEPFTIGENEMQPGSIINYRLKYLEIPVAIKLRTSQFRRMVYWGQFGITNMINISANAESENGLLEKEDVNEDINLFAAGMLVGGGFEFDLGGNNALQLGIVYTGGFTDVMSNDAVENKITLQTIKIQFGIVF